MCVTDRHDMTLAVKVVLNANTTNQPTKFCKVHAVLKHKAILKQTNKQTVRFRDECQTSILGSVGLSTWRSRVRPTLDPLSPGRTLQSPSIVLIKPRKDMNYVSCRLDMTEIMS